MNKLIGRPVKFIPCYMYKKEFHNSGDEDIQPVRGVIDFVSSHGWFRIKYPAGDTVQHECFKLVDIGKAVALLGNKKNR